MTAPRTPRPTALGRSLAWTLGWALAWALAFAAALAAGTPDAGPRPEATSGPAPEAPSGDRPEALPGRAAEAPPARPPEAPSGEQPEALPGVEPAPDRAAELFAAGLAAAAAGDLPAALDRLETAAAARPDDLRYGAEYRQAAIAAEEYDRALAFFEGLAAKHPDSAAVRLNWGYAYVDKIPAAGAVTQVILANTALTRFTEALEREETWLARYTRGNSYVYWPPIFGRTKLGIADLERAVEMAEQGEPRSFHAHAYAALGDAWWRLGELEKAREVWRRGLDRLPGAEQLRERLALEGEALKELLEAHYAIGKRVATDLRELWEEG